MTPVKSVKHVLPFVCLWKSIFLSLYKVHLRRRRMVFWTAITKRHFGWSKTVLRLIPWLVCAYDSITITKKTLEWQVNWKVQMDSRLGRVFPHSCHSALICILIPVYTALSSSCVCLQPPVPRRLCLLSPCPCLDLPPVTLSHRGDRPVCPFKLQTLSQCVREKRDSDQARQGTRGGLSDWQAPIGWQHQSV